MKLFFYLFIINFIAFVLMWYDKRQAKLNNWRIKESTLFIIALIGGSIGIYSGMYKFRHKTKHIKFTIGIPIIFVLNILFLMFLFFI